MSPRPHQEGTRDFKQRGFAVCNVSNSSKKLCSKTAECAVCKKDVQLDFALLSPHTDTYYHTQGWSKLMFILISMADNTGTHRDLIKDTVYERFIFTALAKKRKKPPHIGLSRQRARKYICSSDAILKQLFCHRVTFKGRGEAVGARSDQTCFVVLN